MLVRANWTLARSTFTAASHLHGGARQLALDHPVLLPSERGRRPRAQHRHAPSGHAAEVEEVHAQVGAERDRAGQLQPAHRADRPPAPDDGKRALVEVAERLTGPGLDPAGDVARLLDG